MAREVESKEELDTAVDDLIEEGWKLKNKSSKRAKLRKSNYGSLLGHVVILIFMFWTFGIANLVYALGKNHFSGRTKIVRVKD